MIERGLREKEVTWITGKKRLLDSLFSASKLQSHLL